MTSDESTVRTLAWSRGVQVEDLVAALADPEVDRVLAARSYHEEDLACLRWAASALFDALHELERGQERGTVDCNLLDHLLRTAAARLAVVSAPWATRRALVRWVEAREAVES